LKGRALSCSKLLRKSAAKKPTVKTSWWDFVVWKVGVEVLEKWFVAEVSELFPNST